MKRMTRLQRSLTIAIAVLCTIACFMLALRQNTISNMGYSAWTYIKYGLINKPFTSFASAWEDFSNLWHVYQDNEYLNEALAWQRSYQTLYTQEYNRNQELQGLLEMKNALPDAVSISCEVISRPGQSWNQQVTISAGSASGVKEHMIAVSSQGAVGIVESVQDGTSIVRLLTAPTQPVDIAVQISMDDGSTVEGILRSYNAQNNQYEVVLFDDEALVLPGQKAATSGMGGAFPAGILLGTVADVSVNDESAAVIVYVDPVENIDSFTYVNVIGKGQVHP